MLKVTRAWCEQKLVRVRPTLCQAIHYFWAAQQQRILSHEIEQKRQEQNGLPLSSLARDKMGNGTRVTLKVTSSASATYYLSPGPVYFDSRW